jgi:glutamate/tyrosine decarboxylase-like PLP-dependent enzyme
VAAILDRFEAEIAPYPFGNGHPGFCAWVNSPPAVIGVFAEALAAAMNPSVAGGDHAAVYVERQVIRWLAELAGLPSGAGGLLVSGASMATVTALAIARHQALAGIGVDVRAGGLGTGGVPPLRIYATAQAHGCVRKAVELLGLGTTSVREIETDGDFAMRPAHLARVLKEDQAAGELPVAVVASAGTVNTGAIDPHKWLYVPVDAGVILLAEPGLARAAFSLVPDYLRTEEESEPWFSEYGVEQTRPFRALKIWMAMRQLGLAGYRELTSMCCWPRSACTASA